ncbi:MAG: 50S ribosomal protein L1 [Candidatus Dojkabacteria bacterium]|nr:50S ribosomal protein L1 [Candidatus Dojkabacteria bacterium]
MRRGKKYSTKTKGLDRNISYTLEDGIKKVKTLSYSKFPGTLELHLDIVIPKDKDPKSIKGGVSLPHSSSTKSVRIAVFATPDKDAEAKKAGADLVGMEQIIKDVKAGKVEFDVAIATPSVMPKIAIIGKELGPKGLMPNPKNGTVTDDIASAVSEYKKGKQTFACDASGVIHMNVGKLDLDNEKLEENIHSAISAILNILGKQYEQGVHRMHLAPTMGPSIKISYSKPE